MKLPVEGVVKNHLTRIEKDKLIVYREFVKTDKNDVRTVRTYEYIYLITGRDEIVLKKKKLFDKIKYRD